MCQDWQAVFRRNWAYFLLKQRDHIPSSKNSHEARGFLLSARIGDRSFAKELKQHLETFLREPAQRWEQISMQLLQCAWVRLGSPATRLCLDWWVANSAVGSRVFKGIVTLWPNCSDEAVTRIYVSKNKMQKSSQSAVEVSPVAEWATTPGTLGVSKHAVAPVTLAERRAYLRDKSKQINQLLRLVLQLGSSY